MGSICDREDRSPEPLLASLELPFVLNERSRMPRLSHPTAHDNRNGRNHVNTVKHIRVSRPALAAAAAAVIGGLAVGAALSADDLRLADNRSEERRVGKEGRPRWGPD